MDTPSSLSRGVSPPRLAKRRKVTSSEPAQDQTLGSQNHHESGSIAAAIEAGKSHVENHLAYFQKHLSRALRAVDEDTPLLEMGEFSRLYRNNEHEHGNHFVIHQHNHPRAGLHYDLRLQFSKTSSLSFSVPKGLPGHPNSTSLGRMAIETRVHCLWNHLVESASSKTGSLLIWDTGTYEILPRKTREKERRQAQSYGADGSDRDDSSSDEIPPKSQVHENDKLIQAFQARYIRLRLNGTRLPKGYTVTLRLPTANYVKSNQISTRVPQKRRRKRSVPQASTYTTESEPEDAEVNESTEASDDTDDDENFQIRVNNAYPGSMNSIGSIHQRQWYVSLDRASSGFVKANDGRWVRGDEGQSGFEPFYVRGKDFERSVVTGRLAIEVESDEGVENYRGRSGWVGITR